MRIKHVYEAPEAEALTFRMEGNFCATAPVKVTFGGDGDDEFFGEEEEW